ncbi:porin [Shimia haliotis]|uniref:Outer membrane protein OmpU n=1 Tax=Shimia haliotis TaxID=1280847 RepID=A0A1I4FJR0_9RHOB|nr:porin [Shimia haliotis]SFL17157.1 outer membrane protein OmpU [Shimia haliotis]
MKNVLLASTALVLTAGVAAADITFSGGARFGVLYDSTTGAADELALHNRFTLNIDAATETDSGIEFFARVRVRGGNSGTAGITNSGVSAPRVGMSVGGVEVAVGNIKGALEETPGLYDGAVGLTGLGDLNVVATGNWDSFSSAGAGVNGVEVLYSAGAFGAHLSHSPVSDLTALNASYAFGDWTVAAAYQDDAAAGSANDTWLVTAGGSLGNFGLGAAYGDTDGNAKFRVNGSAALGAGTKVTAFVADDESAAETIWGLGFTHSLGGAVLAGGVVADGTGENQADLGVRFSF